MDERTEARGRSAQDAYGIAKLPDLLGAAQREDANALVQRTNGAACRFTSSECPHTADFTKRDGGRRYQRAPSMVIITPLV
jgi:hypothetical protein